MLEFESRVSNPNQAGTKTRIPAGWLRFLDWRMTISISWSSAFRKRNNRSDENPSSRPRRRADVPGLVRSQDARRLSLGELVLLGEFADAIGHLSFDVEFLSVGQLQVLEDALPALADGSQSFHRRPHRLLRQLARRTTHRHH
jgi:hypothetical protein